MSDLSKEKKQGFSYLYLLNVPLKKILAGKKFHTAGFGLAAQLFASMAKVIIEKLGPEEGEKLIKEGVEYFGRERGKRIAKVVKKEGKDLSFKNWLIYTDISGDNFSVNPRVKNADLVVELKNCTFINAAEKWGLKDFAKIYCKYADHAILEGYNPDIKLTLDSRHCTGADHCLFRYIMKEDNK
jgi:L-2-amino-thiazoline-4-carboxylic acid hydrolase